MKRARSESKNSQKSLDTVNDKNTDSNGPRKRKKKSSKKPMNLASLLNASNEKLSKNKLRKTNDNGDKNKANGAVKEKKKKNIDEIFSLGLKQRDQKKKVFYYNNNILKIDEFASFD